MPGLAERLFFRVAKRWIAGYDIDDAIRVAREANERKINAIINRLGEHTPDPKLIEEYTEEYLKLIERLGTDKIQGCISVKPSQLGLAADIDLYRKNLSIIVDNAENSGRFVWVDMENSPYTESTVQVYKEVLPHHREVGLCLQANMKRTEKDMKELIPMDGKIRLVKGAYPETADVAFKKRSEVSANYVRLLHLLFEKGDSFAVATHDGKLIAEAENLSKEHKSNFEFQLLKGVRDDLKERLAGEGYRIGDYIPYGPEWFNYSKRRLRERKRNILLLIRSIIG